MSRRIAGMIAIGLISGLTGCDRSDGERLRRIGRKVAEKIQEISPDRIPITGADDRPETLVRKRLESDKFMSDLRIETFSGDRPGEIRLRGRNVDKELRIWAVHIAETTVGVTKVTAEWE